MQLKDYFSRTGGFGVLSTCDLNGEVGAAVFSRPHVMEDGRLAWVFRERMAFRNLESNPNAVYLFREDCDSYDGVRLYLKRVGSSQDPELVDRLRRRRCSHDSTPGDDKRHVLIFEVRDILPLVGTGKTLLKKEPA